MGFIVWGTDNEIASGVVDSLDSEFEYLKASLRNFFEEISDVLDEFINSGCISVDGISESLEAEESSKRWWPSN